MQQRTTTDRKQEASPAPSTGRPVRQLAPFTAALSGSDGLGLQLHSFCETLYPIQRSLTGPGVDATLTHLATRIPLKRMSIASGTPVFDWTVPDVWQCDEAFIENERGERIVDASRHGLHLVGYSRPVDRWMPRDDLLRHVHTLPDQPGLIPYRTTYYADSWGFCMTNETAAALPEGRYRAVVRSRLEPGELVWGEYVHEGTTDHEVLLTTHICHPWLANDNCSGLAVLTTLAALLRGRKTRLTYRFLFAPGTIGALCWLSRNEHRLDRIVAGLSLSCLGDAGGPTYKRSRRGNTTVDRAAVLALSENFPEATIEDFSPYGYDERQYCSPGFDLPFGSLQRSRWGKFPEYHTSADDLDFIKPAELERSLRLLASTLDIIDGDWTPISLCQKGEPQLGRRGLYAATGGDPSAAERNMAMLWVLNLADGRHSLVAMAERSRLPFQRLAEAADLLSNADLLTPRPD